MPVEPETAVHREDHPVKAATKLAVRRCRVSRHTGVLGITPSKNSGAGLRKSPVLARVRNQ
jgi:hypothetical protein